MDVETEYALPDIPEAPIFYPSAEEFADPFRYIASIREKAEHAGMLKIVPPPFWKCPCPIKDRADFHFQTCVQPVDQLQRRNGPSARFFTALRRFNRKREMFMADEVIITNFVSNSKPNTEHDVKQIPVVNGMKVDLYLLHKLVIERGALQRNLISQVNC
jgi:hypothetical protein